MPVQPRFALNHMAAPRLQVGELFQRWRAHLG